MASSGRQAEPSSSARKRTDDATGLYVLPGVVDSESHPGCYVPFRHDMTTESKATSMFATKMRFFGRTLSMKPRLSDLKSCLPLFQWKVFGQIEPLLGAFAGVRNAAHRRLLEGGRAAVARPLAITDRLGLGSERRGPHCRCER
jgi:hypothetical protein